MPRIVHLEHMCVKRFIATADDPEVLWAVRNRKTLPTGSPAHLNGILCDHHDSQMVVYMVVT